MRLLAAACLVSALAGCAPRWTKPEFREEAKTRAIAAAMTDHACPRDQVSVRCDASSATQIFDGRMVVYDEDGVIGTYVTETPNWEIELAVCGHVRRYRYEPPSLPTELHGILMGPARPEHGMVEVKRSCGGAYCMGAEPACTNCGRDHWWPVDTMPSSSFCADAIDDGSISVEVVDDAIELVLVVDSPRALARSCGDSPLFVVIDGEWYSLCGDGVAHLRPGVHRIPTGITLGIDTKGGRDHTLEAFDARADRCRRSRSVHTALPRTGLRWTDSFFVSGDQLAPP